MEKIKNTKQDTELLSTPMTVKDLSNRRAGEFRRMWQLRIPFPDAPEWWKDWNWVYNKPEALANINYKMRQWEKGDGGKKFKAQFGERYTIKIDLPDVGG